MHVTLFCSELIASPKISSRTLDQYPEKVNVQSTEVPSFYTSVEATFVISTILVAEPNPND